MLGALCTGLAYFLYYRLLYRIGAPATSTVTYLVPLFGVIWAWVFLGEPLTASMAIAGALILGGVALSQQRASVTQDLTHHETGEPMNAREQEAVLTIALLAAFADGAKDDREREEIKRIADSLTGEAGAPQLSQLYQSVLLKRVDVSQAAAALSDPTHVSSRMKWPFVFAMPTRSRAMRSRSSCKSCAARSVWMLSKQRRSIKKRQRSPMRRCRAASPRLLRHRCTARGRCRLKQATMSDAELDKYILNHSIVNGAIELLPQSLATMAIIPLQLKLVYRIGQAYGVQLDKGHIREFLATAGVGLTSQYVEQFGRKLLGGLLGSVAGGLGRGLGRVGRGRCILVCNDVCTGPAGEALLRGRSADEHRTDSTDLSIIARSGEADTRSVFVRDPAQGQHARCQPGDVDGKERLVDW